MATVPAIKFFAKPELQNTSASRQVINVGGHGDCGFRSVAAGLIDNFHNASKSNNASLKKLITYYYQYYPDYKPNQGLLTPKDHMSFLMNNLHMPELIDSLAFVLRQIAVDEMVAKPECYRSAFVAKHEGTSPARMREKSTWIDEAAIAALAHALSVRIHVSVTSRNHELPLKLRYKPETEVANTPDIALHLKDDHYQPEIMNVALFRGALERKARPIQSVQVKSNDPSLQDIMQRIKAVDQQMLAEFEHTKTMLSAALTANEITMEQLLTRYIESIGTSDYLRGRVKYIGMEHGNQHFFEQIISDHKSDGLAHKTFSHRELVSQELIHALARAVSIGQLSEEALFQEDMPAQRFSR